MDREQFMEIDRIPDEGLFGNYETEALAEVERSRMFPEGTAENPADK